MLKWNAQYQQRNNDKGMMWWGIGHGGVITFHGIIHAPNPPKNNLSHYKNISPPQHLEDSYFLYPVKFQFMWKVILKTKVDKFVVSYFLILQILFAEKSLPES